MHATNLNPGVACEYVDFHPFDGYEIVHNVCNSSDEWTEERRGLKIDAKVPSKIYLLNDPLISKYIYYQILHVALISLPPAFRLATGDGNRLRRYKYPLGHYLRVLQLCR